MWQVTRFWFSVSAWLCLIMADKVCLSNEVNKLSLGHSLSPGQFMVSDSGIFELGFFATSKPDPNMHLGIWYKGFVNRTTVWVAHREKPFLESLSSKLEISEDGNIVLLDESNSILLTQVTKQSFLPKWKRYFLMMVILYQEKVGNHLLYTDKVLIIRQIPGFQVLSW